MRFARPYDLNSLLLSDIRHQTDITYSSDLALVRKARPIPRRFELFGKLARKELCGACLRTV